MLDPTPDNLHRMRALSMKNIRTLDIPRLPPLKAMIEEDRLQPVTRRIEFDRVDVELWLDAHDPWRKRGPQ